jgi:hypothetical protein
LYAEVSRVGEYALKLREPWTLLGSPSDISAHLALVYEMLNLVYVVHVLGFLSFPLLIFIARFLTRSTLVPIATTHHEESVLLVLTRYVIVDISFWLLSGVFVVILIILLVLIGPHMASLPKVVLLDFVSVELHLVFSELLIELRDIFVQFLFAFG